MHYKASCFLVDINKAEGLLYVTNDYWKGDFLSSESKFPLVLKGQRINNGIAGFFIMYGYRNYVSRI